MNKNRLLLVVGMISVLAISLAISSFQTSASVASREAASDFYERHPDWTVAAPDAVAYYPDYFERHPELSSRAPSSVDLTDYYFRHIND